MVYGVPGHKSLLQHEREPGTHAPGMPQCLSHLPQGLSVFSLPLYHHLQLQAHYTTRAWQPPLGPGQTDHLKPQEEEDEERGPQWLFLSLCTLYAFGRGGQKWWGSALVSPPGSLFLHF